MKKLIPVVLAAVVVLVACKTAYYSMWEKLGREKRDILRVRVTDERDAQKAAGEQFKSALDRMKALYDFNGGKLETAYDRFKSEYDDCVVRADKVHSRIKDVESVANDLFKEWEGELKQISDPTMRADGRRKLEDSRDKYYTLHSAMKRAEASMDPVLTKFHDNVLYLKINLDAQAIGALKGEGGKIETDVSHLLDDMNASITEAENFIKTLDQQN
jgi:hypothetical protein